MSTFTIYTVSDPMVIGSAMTSMAMFFGQDSWVAGAIKTGLIISLIVILAQSVSSQKLRLDVMLLQLLVVWVMFIPKATVQIEQFDNSAPPRVVDGVPYAIALPATMAGAFAMYMTQKIETVMVNTDGNYLTVSGDVNPFAPARVLLSFTACAQTPLACLPRDIVETLRLGVRYCAGPSLTSSNNTTFAKSNHVFSDIAATFTQQGSTIIYDSTNPYLSGGGGGRSASCDEARAFIAGYEGQVISGTQAAINDNLTDLAQRAMIVNNKTATRASGQIDLNQALNMVNMLTDSSTRVDELALFNVMAYSVADAFQENADSPIDTLIAARRDANLFAWAKTEANQAMLMSTAAPKFMDVLFFIFVACTPIVMFVVIANPSTGLKVAGSYALFGLWTQSWIPMMAIVTAWYQRELLSIAPPSFGVIQTSSSITPEYMSTMMQHVMTTTIAAGNMIQNAPYLMFAILSGSMFAMSNMIGKAMPSGGGADLQGGGSGGSGSGGSAGGKGSAGSPIMAQKAGLMSASNFLGGGMADGSSGPRADIGANIGGLAELSSGGGVSMAQSATREANAATRNQIATSAQQSLSDLSSIIEAGGLSKRGEKLSSYMRNQGFDASYNASDNTMSIGGQKYSLDSAQDRTTKAAKGGRAEASVQADLLKAVPSLGGALLSGNVLGGVLAGQAASAAANSMGIKVGAAVSGFLATDTSDSQKVAMSGGVSNEKKKSNQQGDSFGTKDGKTASDGFSGADGGSWSKMGQKAKSISDNLSKIASQMKSLDDSDKLSTTASNTANNESGVRIKGSDVVQGWGDASVQNNNGANSSTQNQAQGRVMDAIGRAIDPANRSQFEASMSAEYQKLAQSFGTGANKDQLAAAAAWRALSQQSGSGDMPQRLEALNAMAHLAKSAGLGDLTSSLGAAAKAANLSADVSRAVSKQSDEVKPVVADAVTRANDGLSNKNINSMKADASAVIAGGEGAANRNIGAAAAGAAGMHAEANAARSSYESTHPDKTGNLSEIADGFRRGVGAQATINPQPEDASGYIRTSMGGKGPEERIGDPRGANSVPPASTSPSPSPSPQTISQSSSGGGVSPSFTQGALNVSAPVTAELAQVMGKASDLGLSTSGSVAQFVTAPSSDSSSTSQSATGGATKPNAQNMSSTQSSKPMVQKAN